MDKIASLAKFDKTSGQWSVDVGGEMKSLEELKNTPGLLEKALQKPTTEKDAAIKTAEGVMTTNEKLQSIVNATQTGIVIKTDVYGKVEDQMSTQLSKLNSTTSEFMNTITKTLTSTDYFKDLSEVGDLVSSTISDETTDLISNVSEKLNRYLEGLDTLNISNSTVNIDGVLQERPPNEVNNGGVLQERSANDLYSGPGSSDRVLTGSFGSFKLDSRDLIAAGDPKKLLSSVNSNQKLDVSGTINFGNITITMDGNTENISFTEKDKKEMMKSIKSQIIAGVNGMIGANKVSGKDSLMMG